MLFTCRIYENIWVFIERLKDEISSDSLISTGRSFHNVLVIYVNDFWSHSRLKRGCSSLVPVPRKLYLTNLSLKNSLIYVGPKI